MRAHCTATAARDKLRPHEDQERSEKRFRVCFRWAGIEGGSARGVGETNIHSLSILNLLREQITKALHG
jgi:hypothetical protein